MKSLRKENDEVFYPLEETVLIDKYDLEELKRLVKLNSRKRIRICTHQNTNDSLHEMFIVLTNETYVRPHKHINKLESFYIIEGKADLLLFDDYGKLIRIIEMGDSSYDLPTYYRHSGSIYHSFVIHSEYLVLHEVTNGPFYREQTIFAEWSPESIDAREWALHIFSSHKAKPINN